MEIQQRWQTAEANIPKGGLPGRKRITMEVGDIPFQAKEAINVLRGNIQMSGADLKTIAVTSALAHEGKSSIAFRLARSLANLEKRTLYLDCDIRNSITCERYGVTAKTIGLTEYLCGRAELTNVIYGTEDPWLDVIFTGAKSPNPSELISSELFGDMVACLRRHYDYVILDTAPVNMVIDGILVARKCDGTILVVENGVTERAELIRAKQQLDHAGIKTLGAVFNKVGLKKKHYGYGYGGYGYGYGYGEKKEKDNRKQ